MATSADRLGSTIRFFAALRLHRDDCEGATLIPDGAERNALDTGSPQFVNVETEEEISMHGYDLYINPQKPAVGLYVDRRSGSPRSGHAKEWAFDGTVAQDQLPPELVQRIETNGHAFRDMD